MAIKPVGPAPEGYTLAEYDHHFSTRDWSGAYQPCWVRPATELKGAEHLVHIIPIRKDGDWSGMFYVRSAACVRYPEAVEA